MSAAATVDQPIPTNIPRKFDFGITALEIVRAYATNLKGKTAIVTGGGSGIGIETVRALAVAGAHVIVGVRDITKAQSIINEFKQANLNNIELY